MSKGQSLSRGNFPPISRTSPVPSAVAQGLATADTLQGRANVLSLLPTPLRLLQCTMHLPDPAYKLEDKKTIKLFNYFKNRFWQILSTVSCHRFLKSSRIEQQINCQIGTNHSSVSGHYGSKICFTCLPFYQRPDSGATRKRSERTEANPKLGAWRQSFPPWPSCHKPLAHSKEPA